MREFWAFITCIISVEKLWEGSKTLYSNDCERPYSFLKAEFRWNYSR